ncbi:DnaD domain protein [Bacillus songklensis]|uniref:DnaD domain protein n=1 Tax=Bacillus songklensis TaxID=1069116 RepID=A0ABV8B688_9BACI
MLIDTVQPVELRDFSNIEPDKEVDKMAKQFETISPFQLLIQLSSGVEPAESDIGMIEHLMRKYKLTPGVTNVLIDYVSVTTDMGLPKPYMERLAAHWNRKRIKRVKHAMTVAREEHRQVQRWKTADMSKGKWVDLYLSYSSITQLQKLAEHFGFETHDQTIMYLLNEAYKTHER